MQTALAKLLVKSDPTSLAYQLMHCFRIYACLGVFHRIRDTLFHIHKESRVAAV